MNVLRTRSLRARCTAIALAISAVPLLCVHAANAHTYRPARARIISTERVFAAASLPRHIATFGVRADLRGDTPLSTKYFKITNLTAEAYGYTGYGAAVNNDGRIAYNDFGDGVDQNPPATIINNGGTYAALPFPVDTCVNTNSDAYALNEAGEAVGNYGCSDSWDYYFGYAGWSLTGATTAKVAYYDQRYSYSEDYSYADAVNDHDVAVGCDGDCGEAGSAAVFEPAKSSHGSLRELLGLKGQQCFATATGINDAGQIVGFACGKAVRFSLNGYAEPLVANEASSFAEAINARGDVAGFFNRGAAFLYRQGKMSVLPLPPGDKDYSSYAYAINATDEVVGMLYGPTTSAFVYLNGHSYDLNTLIPPDSGWTIVGAYGVNDHGEIVGEGYYNGNLYGVSLKPPV
jgi:hypothetical protein